jgi:hypothetical protein
MGQERDGASAVFTMPNLTKRGLGAPFGGRMMFPDDATAGGEKSLEAQGHLPSGKLSARLVVRGVEKDEIE